MKRLKQKASGALAFWWRRDMRCKVGYWKTGLAVQLDEEAREWFFQDNMRRQMQARVLADRRVLLIAVRGPGASIIKITHNGVAHHSRDMYGQCEVLPPHLEFAAGPGFELPRFELHELAMEYDFAMDGLLTEPLEADFALPWPSRKHRANRMTAEEMRHQCYLRIKAHLLFGGFGAFDEVNVPREVVRIMAGGYKLALDRAKAEVSRLKQQEAL